MQRKAYAPGLATASLLAALTVLTAGGCTAADGGDSATDPKSGDSKTTAAPGRYRTLPEPCGSVGRDALEELLPGTASLPEDTRQKVLRGASDVTYDTDRRVGCRWKAEAAHASHQLRVDFERVVSYDGAVSDDDRAQQVFAKKQDAALPDPVAPRRDEDSTDAAEDAGAAEDDGGADAAADGSPAEAAPPTSSPSPSSSPSAGASGSPFATPSGGAGSVDGLQPRILDGLGDAAFIDDALGGAGGAAHRRTVSVVFRTSNVIVTIQYMEQSAPSAAAPSREEMQDRAQNLARRLVDQFEE
ncbi:DUF3558 domain-containing protein [Streptomyces sp. MUM 178J]|uniref:DUF3558 domain-containing protein n=1 Tax=Streptomyces sp. MUM 178J TaxID=2791991 RepID=UPI001F0351A2|nr:DUF3558 domain-containing protein [Streptomyces sp. MUM 178J]WRQ82042.1 DUF3558 domain-containing protein [Streptomyces sp. MUM 178J]